jgi:hypothetical protein
MKRQTTGTETELATDSGGGSGGTVDQGTGGSSAWLVELDPTQFPIPVDATLDPTGLATSANQTTEIAHLAAIELATESIDTKLTNPLPVSGTVAVSNFPATQPISAVALPLPTGAATEATLASLDGKVTAVDTGNVTIGAALPAGTNIIGGIRRAGYQNAVWDAQHVPAANTQATITQAAAGGGIKNVCIGFTVTLASTGSAPTAIQLVVNLIDGASGGGTYLWRSVIALPAVAGAMVSIVRSGIWIPGTANTQMTLEFSAAGGANTIESVTMEGTTE